MPMQRLHPPGLTRTVLFESLGQGGIGINGQLKRHAAGAARRLKAGYCIEAEVEAEGREKGRLFQEPRFGIITATLFTYRPGYYRRGC